jgi:hypothetical protein
MLLLRVSILHADLLTLRARGWSSRITAVTRTTGFSISDFMPKPSYLIFTTYDHKLPASF